jgi:hypothetical protein
MLRTTVLRPGMLASLLSRASGDWSAALGLLDGVFEAL